MKRLRLFSLFLLLALLLTLCACGGKRSEGYDVLERLGTEQFSVVFRRDDPLGEFVSAAMREVAADGTLTRLSGQYLGKDYSCLEGQDSALARLGTELPAGRVLMVGVVGGAAPLCWRDDSGSFTGLIPDFVRAVADKLGWEIAYHEILVEDVLIELNSGNVDCAWVPAAFAESSSYSLSPAWMENSHLLIVRHGSGINKVKDLRKHNVGMPDKTAVDAFKNNTKIYDSVTIWTYSDIRSCFSALAAGDCDGIVIDDIVSAHYLNG